LICGFPSFPLLVFTTNTPLAPGFFSQQSSGQPGKDASDFFIRGVSSLNADGNKPLIIVDDVQYTYEQLSQINVNEKTHIDLWFPFFSSSCFHNQYSIGTFNTINSSCRSIFQD